MNKKIRSRLVNISQKLFNVPIGRHKHFSFVLKNGKIIALGYSHAYKTHSKSSKMGYRFDAIHSELDVIIRCQKIYKDLSKFTLVNVKLNHLKQPCMSKPCEICQQMMHMFKKVYYTNRNGEFIKL